MNENELNLNKETRKKTINKLDNDFINSLHYFYPICAKLIKPGERAYICSCFGDDCLVMCTYCFEAQISLHNQHKYSIILLDEGGCCDCSEISGSQCKLCSKSMTFQLTKDIKRYTEDLIDKFIENQKVLLIHAHQLIPTSDSYALVVLHNFCESSVDLEVLLKKLNSKNSYQDVYNIIDQIVQYGQICITKDNTDREYTMDKAARLFSSYQFYTLTSEEILYVEVIRKEIKEIIPFLKYKEYRDFMNEILKRFHVPQIFNYCKNTVTVNDERDFMKYIETTQNYDNSNYLNFLLCNILRLLPFDSEILYEIFMYLLEDEENKIIIGNNLIDNYVNNIDYFLSGYGDILKLNMLISEIFYDNNVIVKLNDPFIRLFELVIEFQRRYDTVEPGESHIPIKRRESFQTVIKQYSMYIIYIYIYLYLYSNICLLIDLPNVINNSKKDILNEILDIINALMDDSIIGEKHLKVKRETMNHITTDIVSLAQGPLFRVTLYRIITKLYKLFIPNGLYNTDVFYNLNMIIEKIIQDNTPLIKECYKNQDVGDENGYLMFLNEHLLASIIYTMTSKDLDNFHQHLYDTYTTSLIYNDENNNEELEEEEERKAYHFIVNDNKMMEIEDNDENFECYNIPLTETRQKRIMPVKSIPKTIFGCLRYFLTIVQHKSNLWVKNGLLFTAKVKSCSTPYCYELMCHYLQFFISFTESEKILRLLEVIFDIYAVQHNYLNQRNVNLTYYNEFLTFVLTLLTNPIPLSDNGDGIDDDIFSEYLRIDIVHLLLERNYTFNDIVRIIHDKYYYKTIDEIKDLTQIQLDIIASYNSRDGIYSLNKNFNYYYNPFYLSNNSNQNLVDVNSNFTNHDEFKPFPLIFANECLKNLYNVIYSKEYNEIIKSNLTYFKSNINNQSNSKIFTLLQPTLWMIIIEVEEKEHFDIDITYLKNINDFDSNTFSILMKYKDDTVFGKQIKYILKRFNELGIVVKEYYDNTKMGSSSDIELKSKRKLENILNKMKSKQMRVLKTMENVKEEELKEDENSDDDNEEEKDDKHFPDCVICKSNINNNIDIGPLVIPVTMIPVISYEPQEVNITWSINSLNNANLNNNERYKTISLRRKIISCDHIMHLKCLNNSAERSCFQKIVQQMVSSVDTKRREYTCPTCRGLYNLCLLIPNHCDEEFLPKLIEKGDNSPYKYWNGSILIQPYRPTMRVYVDKEGKYFINLHHKQIIQQQQQPLPPIRRQQQHNNNNNQFNMQLRYRVIQPPALPQRQVHPISPIPIQLQEQSQQMSHIEQHPPAAAQREYPSSLLYQQQRINTLNINSTPTTTTTATITTTSLGAVPLLYDNEVIHNYTELYSILVTTIIDSANNLNNDPIKKIDYFMIKCVLFNCQYFLSTQFLHSYDINKFSIIVNPQNYLEILLYQIFACPDPDSVFMVLVQFLYNCLCCNHDNANSYNKRRKNIMKKDRINVLREISNGILKYNSLEELYENCGEFKDLYYNILNPLDFEMRIIFIIYHSFNSNSNEREAPKYDFINCFINFDLPKIINEYNLPRSDAKIPFYPSLDRIKKRHLIELPFNTEELLKIYLKECNNCKIIPKNPGLCLICGEILCPSSACCEHDKIGEVTLHCMNKHGGVGMTLSLTNYKIYLTRFQYSLEYMALYIKDDPKQGIEEFNSRYDMLETMFENDNIFETVFQKVDISPYYIIHNAF